MEPLKSSVWIPCDSFAFQPRPMNDFALFLGKFSGKGLRSPASPRAAGGCRRPRSGTSTGGRSDTLVELGAGTGPITRVIARHAATELPGGRDRTRPRFRAPASRAISRYAELRYRRGRRARPDVDPCRLRDRSRRPRDFGTCPCRLFPGTCNSHSFRPSARSCGSDGTFNQITEIPWVYWPFYRRYFRRRAICVRAAQPAAGGGLFLQGNQDMTG